MKRTNAQPLSEILKDFLNENPQVDRKIAEVRVINAWANILGPLTQKYTTGIYIRNRILYVKISSAVLRSELMMCRERLIKNLNENAGSTVIEDIIISG